MQGDVEVEKLNVSKEGKTIKIAAGTYVVEVDGDSDNIAAEGNTVLLSRGGVETVKIELKKNSDPVAGGWAPPENPDPNEILREAEEDRRSGKYQQALEKHLWYHENALRIDPGQGGVRLSFALNSWLELGEKYPPALAKMREVRDATEDKIRDQDRVRVKFEDFHDFSAFNNTLRQPSRTAALFKWLDGENSEDAAIVYPVAEAALIDQQEYKICGKYVDPTENVKQIHDRYVTGVKMSAEFGEHHLKHTEDALVNASSTLVEILVMNDRKTEAQTAADSLKKLIKGKALSTKLEKEISRVMKRQRTNSVAETWTPPENPDPKKILSEAQEDKRSGNYQRALTKHLWYHENALRIQPSLTGVRTKMHFGFSRA